MSRVVYIIENKVNGKKYIGSSIVHTKRWLSHKSQLRRNEHTNVYLQRSWNKHGEDNFEFKILETYKHAHRLFLLWRERECIKNLKSLYCEHGYNLCYPSLKINGNVCSEETKEKIRQANLGANNAGSKKVVHLKTGQIFDSIGEASRITGLSPTVVSNSIHGRPTDYQNYFELLENCDDTFENMFKKRDEQRKQSIIKSKCGEMNGRSKKIKCLEDNNIFSTIEEASKYYNIERNRLSKAAKSGKTMPRKKLTFRFI